MNRFITVGLAIAVAPAILLAIGVLSGSDDTAKVSEVALFAVALPLGTALVVVGLIRSQPTLLQIPAKGWEILRGVLRPRSWEGKFWLLLSFALCGFALFQPFESDVGGSSPTWWKLLFGWFFVWAGETLVWLSAPLLLGAWIALGVKKPNGAMVLAALALGIALPFLYRPVLTYGWGEHIYRRAQTPEIGYFLALGAMLAALVGGIRMRRSISANAPAIPLHIIVFCLVALIGPVSMVGIRKVEVVETKAADIRRHEEARRARELENLARRLTRSWTKQQLTGLALNDIPHAPAGAVPTMLGVKRRGHQAEVLNKLSEEVQVEMWFTYPLPTGSKVICNFSRPEGTPTAGGIAYGLGPKLAPGETALVEVRAPAFDFRDACFRRAGNGPLEFAVKSGDKKRVLFLSDPVFGPAPPPRAEWIIEYKPW
jgi:hypothetical protein